MDPAGSMGTQGLTSSSSSYSANQVKQGPNQQHQQHQQHQPYASMNINPSASASGMSSMNTGIYGVSRPSYGVPAVNYNYPSDSYNYYNAQGHNPGYNLSQGYYQYGYNSQGYQVPQGGVYPYTNSQMSYQSNDYYKRSYDNRFQQNAYQNSVPNPSPSTLPYSSSTPSQSTSTSTSTSASTNTTFNPKSQPVNPIDNAKNLLQVFCGRFKKIPTINFLSQGPDHDKTFLCKVVVPLGDLPDITTEYVAKTKKDAEKCACTLAYNELEKRSLLKHMPKVIDDTQPQSVPHQAFEEVYTQSDVRVEDTSKQNLMVYCSKIGKELLSSFDATGPVHMREFFATVTISGTEFTAKGKGKTKKEAEKIACAIILKKLSEEGKISYEEESLSRKREIKDFCDRHLNGQTPYIEFQSYGPPHQPMFIAKATIMVGEKTIYGSGESSTKKEAERMALSTLYEKLVEFTPNQRDTTPTQFNIPRKFPEPVEENFYDSPYPINVTNTEKWHSIIKFYCSYYNLPPLVMTETSNKSDYIVTITVEGVNFPNLQIKSKNQNLLSAKANALGYTYSVLESRHSKLFHIAENLYDKNTEDIMPKIEITNQQKEELKKIIHSKKLICNTEVKIEQKRTFEMPQPKWIKEKSEELFLDKQERLSRPTQYYSESQRLPIQEYKSEILRKIEENQVLIVSSETGSGKTTQIPQFILDFKIDNKVGSLCNIIVTQPRRISAMTIAQRVASERGEGLGRTVGYKVRFEEVMPQYGGSILFCTTGMLLRMVISEDVFKKYNYLIIDEVHERNLETDQLLALVKDLLPLYPSLKVILMSATINSSTFYDYFAPKSDKIEISTQTQPITDLFLQQIKGFLRESNLPTEEPSDDLSDSDDESNYNYYNSSPDNDPERLPYTLIESLLSFICSSTNHDCSILVFLPGWEQIQKMLKMMKEDRKRYGFSQPNFLYFTLHSSVSSQDQRSAFVSPPTNCRKIVFATDIAESSITIPDIVFVIDSARVKQMRYITEKNMSSLDIIFTSKANIIQRRGRAGRTCPGTYFCLLNYEVYQSLPEYNIPEILRLDLQNVCLEVASIGKKPIKEFLSSVISPPSPEQVNAAINRLVSIGALSEDQKITPLGKQLSSFPVNASHARMILHSLLFKCLDPILTIVASLNTKDIFQTSPELKKYATEKRVDFSKGLNSDHFATLFAYNKWKESLQNSNQYDFVSRNNLSQSQLQTLNKIKIQLYDTLDRTGLIQSLGQRSEPFGGDGYNVNSNNIELIRSLMAPGLSPNYAVRLRKKLFMTPTDKKTAMHPSSVNKKAATQNSSRIYVYQERLKTSRVFLIGTTLISPLSALLFCERLVQADQDFPKIVFIDGWIPVLIDDDESVQLLLFARQSMDSFFKYVFVDLKVFEQTQENMQVISCLKNLFSSS